MIYLVLLKLSAAEDTYPRLITYLKSFNYWARPMPSVWFIDTYQYTSTIRDDISQRISSSDQVLVIEVNKNWASWNIEKVITDWMKNNI